MGKYNGPVCRLCRREGIKLFFKGPKCVSDKCPVARRPFPPGQHGKRRTKLSDYGVQMREKQKVRRIYGLLERQFKFYFHKAERSRGVTGEKLLEFLERRLDNVIFRLLFTLTRREARQMLSNGHVYVKNRKVNRPSCLVSIGDVVQLKVSEKQKGRVKELLEQAKDRTVPGWLKPDPSNLKTEVVSMPKREDVSFPIKEQLIVELYSK
ncbi:MAG: 30S ribosomal protein S4 [Candidatus Omnitrophica bacterium]|nr:30S ribosomal protein S4 [Candidatus Omnitrophota bacterium]